MRSNKTDQELLLVSFKYFLLGLYTIENLNYHHLEASRYNRLHQIGHYTIVYIKLKFNFIIFIKPKHENGTHLNKPKISRKTPKRTEEKISMYLKVKMV